MSARPRLLYVTHRVPYPPDKGDRIRNWNVLRQLAAHASVQLITLADEMVPSTSMQTLHSVCDSVQLVPLPRARKYARAARAIASRRSLSATIQAMPIDLNGIDAVIVSASSLAPLVAQARHLPRFVDVVDVDSQKWFDFAESSSWPKTLLYRYEAARLREIESDLARWAYGVSLVSDAETQLFNRVVQRDVAFTATNGVDLDYFHPRSGEALSRTLVFTGAMDYLPNIDAVTWFAQAIWPSIRKTFPDAEFRIVGRNPSAAVQALARQPGIVITGTVPDVRHDLARATAVVVPMRLSRGLQNKVIEAMGMGQAVIASPPALAALGARHDHDLLRAETVENWIASITSLFNDSARRLTLGQNARHYVETHHDWATCLKPLTDRVLAACGVAV